MKRSDLFGTLFTATLLLLGLPATPGCKSQPAPSAWSVAKATPEDIELVLRELPPESLETGELARRLSWIAADHCRSVELIDRLARAEKNPDLWAPIIAETSQLSARFSTIAGAMNLELVENTISKEGTRAFVVGQRRKLAEGIVAKRHLDFAILRHIYGQSQPKAAGKGQFGFDWCEPALSESETGSAGR